MAVSIKVLQATIKLANSLADTNCKEAARDLCRDILQTMFVEQKPRQPRPARKPAIKEDKPIANNPNATKFNVTQEERDLCRNHGKLEACKAYKNRTGMSLLDSKHVIERDCIQEIAEYARKV